MVQIPDWTSIAPAVPTPSYRRVQVDESARGIDEQISNLGQGLEQVGNQDYARNVNFARAQASSALIDHELAVKTQTEAIRDQVAAGQISWDQAPKVFNDWYQKQQAPAIQGLDPLGQETLERGMKRNALGGALAVQGIAAAGRKQAFADNFDTTMGTLGKLAGMPGADVQSVNNQIDAYRPQALEAGIAPAIVDKAIQGFKDRNWLNQATQRSMEAKESLPALQQLQHDLTAADGFYAGRLDTEKRDMVLRTVINDQMILQNRAEHERDKREAKAQGAIGRIDEQISSGIPATSDMWDAWQRTTQGTSFEDDFKQRLKDEDQVQQVLRQPIEQQMSFVQQRAAQLESQGGTLRDRANLIRLQTAVNQNANLLEKAPLLYAANRNGTEVHPLDFSALNPPNPIAAAIGGAQGAQQPDPRAQFQAQVSDRMATLKAMRTQYGPQVTPTPLLPQEAAALAGQLDSAVPADRAKMLIALRGATGDDQAYQNMMRQIAPHSPVTAIAGMMVSNNAPAATPVYFDPAFAPKIDDVTHVLRGEALLNPASGGKAAASEQEGGKGTMKGGMPMPPDQDTQKLGDGLRSLFGREAGGQFGLFRDRPQLADDYFSVFKAAYASLLAEKGDMRGLGDPTVAQQALKIALGNHVDFNGYETAVPAGMDPSHFPGLVRNAVQATAAQLKASPDWEERLQGYTLRELGQVGSGQYQLMSGNKPLSTPDGSKPFTIDLRDQYLASRGLHRASPDYRSPVERLEAESLAQVK